MIIEAFKNKIFQFYSGNYYHDLGEEETSETENEESEKDKASVSKLEKLAIDSDKILDPSNALKEIVKQLKNHRRQNKTSAEYNNKMTLLIAGLIRLENVIKNMPDDDIRSKGLDLLKDIVRKVFDANRN